MTNPLPKHSEPSSLVQGSVGDLKSFRIMFNSDLPKFAFLKVERDDGTEVSFRFPVAIENELFGQMLSDFLAIKAKLAFIDFKAQVERKRN